MFVALSLRIPMKRRVLLALVCSVALLATACSNSDADAIDADGSIDSTLVGDTDTTAVSEEVVVDDGSAETDAMGEEGEAAPTSTSLVETAAGSDQPDRTIVVPEGVPAEQATELTAAALAGGSLRFTYPYFYITADQTCDGCIETVSLYFAPLEGDASRHSLVAAYEGGVESPVAGVAEVLRSTDPLYVAEALLIEIGEGRDAAYEIDPVSGIVTSWTIDGQTVTLRCFEADTRPSDMRETTCAGSLIG